jgi:hopanoid biosynthesis associated protein HpnK
LSVAVNEAVEQACREGVLSTASLMVAGGAAADAVRRAKALPGLRVGLHLVLVDGPACLPFSMIPDLLKPSPAGGSGLVDGGAARPIPATSANLTRRPRGIEEAKFSADQARLGIRYFFDPRARRQMRAEITAQFAAFAATGLPLDHANAHKHMHLHPTVGRMMIDIGRGFGLQTVRIPSEPADTLAACGTETDLGARAMQRGTALLRWQARRLRTNDHAFGIAWSGHMTAQRIVTLAANLPPGLSEIYFHPATHTDATLAQTMPGYEHAAELQALLDPAVRDAFRREGVILTTYGQQGHASSPAARG